MPHGTTIYFQHRDESSWRDQLLEIEKILAQFGASAEAWQFYKQGDRKYRAIITKGFEASINEAKIVSRNERTVRIECDSVNLLANDSINQIEIVLARPDKHPVLSNADTRNPKSRSKSLGISLIYRPSFYFDEVFKDPSSRGVWRLNVDIPLDPNLAQTDVEFCSLYCYEEVWDYYELMKRLHHEVGFDLTAGSFEENYYQFGESEGTRPGFDSLFRFDRNGPSRVILPYEERRPFRTERDQNGNNEISVDFETGLYHCVVPAGPM